MKEDRLSFSDKAPFGALFEVEIRTYLLMKVFHQETDCGEPYHCPECEMVALVFGYDSWEEWHENIGPLTEDDD